MATKSSTSIPSDELTGNQVLNDQLNETEIGAFIAKNKTLSISLIIVLILGFIGYGVYKAQKSKADKSKSDEVFVFMDLNFKNFVDGKTPTKDFLASHGEMATKVKNFNGLFPTNILIADELIKKNELTQAQNFLEQMNTGAKNSYQVMLIALRLAAVYEDLDQPAKAIEQLERVNNLKTGVLESKIYLDLGRLYLQKGDKDKAKAQFDYVINNMAQDEFAKLAKLYLSELN